MREARSTRTISGSPEVVWDYLADYRNVVRLVGPGCDAHLVTGEHGVPGAHYAVTITWEGLSSKFSAVLQEGIRPVTLLYMGASPGSSGAMRFDVEPAGDGRTVVTATSLLWMSKGMRPLEPFGWALSSRMFDRMLRRLEATDFSTSD